MPQVSRSSQNSVVQHDTQRTSREVMLGCLELIGCLAKEQVAEGKQQRVLALLEELRQLVGGEAGARTGDKIEPGTRTAEDKIEPGTRTAEDKIEPGTRSAPERSWSGRSGGQRMR